MKTNNIITRKLGEYTLPQRTKDEYYNATDLLSQWNNKNPDRQRSLQNFWQSTHLTEFMSEVAKNELNFKSLKFSELKSKLSQTTRGKLDQEDAATTPHPLFFYSIFLKASFIVLSLIVA